MSTAPRSVFIALLMTMFASTGCGRGDSGVQPEGESAQVGRSTTDKDLTLAVIPKSIGGEFWETVELGAHDAAKELGVTIKWEGASTETEMAEQNKIIESMINMGVDGIAIAPLNSRATRKPVDQVAAAGIPVVIFDSNVEGDSYLSYVATDNTAGGALAAKYLVEKLGPERKRLFLLRYIQGTGSTEQRAQGFIDTAKAAGLQIVADPYSDDATVAGAIKTATNSLEGYINNGKLEIDGIFATNLFSTMGMLTALNNLRQSGVETDVIFVGFDTSPKLVQEVQEGNVDALVSQHPRRMGYLAVETLVRHLRGEKVDRVIDTGVELVTRERLEKEPAIRKLVGLE